MKAAPVVGKQPTRFAELMASLDTDNVDLKITVMQLINAMLSTGDDDDHKDIKETFTIDKVVDTLRKGQMKEALHVQLDIFDQMMDDLSHSEDVVGDREYPFPPPPTPLFFAFPRSLPRHTSLPCARALSRLLLRALGSCSLILAHRPDRALHPARQPGQGHARLRRPHAHPAALHARPQGGQARVPPPPPAFPRFRRGSEEACVVCLTRTVVPRAQ